MAYFGSRHTATAIEKFDASFRCEACGIERGARAVASGTGSAASPYFIDEGGARDRASEEAYSNALEAAQVYLLIVPCPVCGKRNRGPAKEFVRTSWIASIAIAAVGMVIGGMSLSAGSPVTGLVVGSVALLGSALYGFVRKRTWDQAEHMVVFFEGEAPDRPYTGKQCSVCNKRIMTIEDGLRCAVCGVALHRKKCKKAHRLAKHPSD
jgi:hypothetical protein